MTNKFLIKKSKFSMRHYCVSMCAALISVTLFGQHVIANQNHTATSNSTTLTQDDMPNLVKNSDFSLTKQADATSKWHNNEALEWEMPWIDSKVNATDGEVSVINNALLIGSKNATNRYRAATSQRVVVDSSKVYLFEYDIRTENVNGSGARVRLYRQDDNNQNLPNQYDYTEYVTGTTATKRVSKIITLTPETKKLKIELFLENSTGKAYFDNVSLREYVPKGNQTPVDVEKDDVTLATNKHYLVKRPDLRYVVSDDNIATVKTGLILPKKEGTTAVQVYDGTTKVGTFNFIVKKHTDTIYDQLRTRWSDISLGNSMYNPKDDKMVNFLSELEKGVNTSLSLWQSPKLQLSSIFSDIAFKSSSDLTKAYRRLEQMAQVVSNPYSAYYQDHNVLRVVKDGLKWLNQTHYNEQSEITSITDKGNWWDYEIGTPRALLNTLIYMYPYFTQDDIMHYTQAVRKFVPDTTMIRMTSKMGPVKAVGGNQTDISKVSILEGILREDSQRIQSGSSALETIMFFVDKGEGFYKDGSFIDHTDVAYTGAYGNVLIEGFSQLLPVIQNSPFALPKDKIDIIDEWIDKAFMPIIVNGELMDMTRGRSISRANGQSHVQAMEILRSLLRLAQSATDNRKQQLLEYVKGQMTRDTFFNHYLATKTYKDIELINQLMADTTIKGQTPQNYIAAFNNMDKFVYHSQTHGFTFGLSMYSNKTQNYEYMNKENRQGWYTGDGMAYLYNGDLSHYSDNYWATVNPYYLPGTTVTNEVRSDKQPGMVNLKSDFVGATQLGQTLATVGMDFNNWNDTLTARKSWFVLGDKVVFLTTDINHTAASAVTTVENRKLTNSSYQYYINNQLVDLSTVNITDKTKSFYMTNGNVKESIGYVFLNDIQTHAVVDHRQGSWHDVNEGQSKNTVTNAFAALWTEHGKQPSQLAYVMVPNKSMADVQKAADSVQVLQQTKDLQVVYDKSLNVWGVVKYTDTPYMIDHAINLTSKGMYVVEKKKDGSYHIAFYNPSKQTSATQVTSVNDMLEVSVLQQKTESVATTIWQAVKKKTNVTKSFENNNQSEPKKTNQTTRLHQKNKQASHATPVQKSTVTHKSAQFVRGTRKNIATPVIKDNHDDEQTSNHPIALETQQTTNQATKMTTVKQKADKKLEATNQDKGSLYAVIAGGIALFIALGWFILSKK